MKQQYIMPNALALTTAIIYVLCRMLVGLFPEASFAIAQSWFHGIGFNKIEVGNLTMPSFLLGLISSMVTAWAVGFIFITVRKLLSR